MFSIETHHWSSASTGLGYFFYVYPLVYFFLGVLARGSGVSGSSFYFFAPLRGVVLMGFNYYCFLGGAFNLPSGLDCGVFEDFPFYVTCVGSALSFSRILLLLREIGLRIIYKAWYKIGILDNYGGC